MSNVFNFTFVPWFRSVAPYIHKHRGNTLVVGIAGEAIAAGKLQNIVQDLALIQSMGVKIVLVHGFRPQVNEQLRLKGVASLSEVHRAYLETTGEFSVIRASDANKGDASTLEEDD